MTLIDFSLDELYKDNRLCGNDPLELLNEIVDWKAFRPELEKLYSNKNGLGGRPNIDPVIMLKIIFLAEINNLTDKKAEFAIRDRISFRKFLGFPEHLPDESTIWVFRDRLANTGLDKKLMKELCSQIEKKGYKIVKGVSQDASFIDADPGHQTADTPRGDDAKTRRSRDGKFAVKYKKAHFGYKVHTLVDNDNDLIWRMEMTPANVHDSQVDLSEEGEVVFRDKGYFGTTPTGYDATMQRGVRGKKLDIRGELRNKRISKTRNRVERPYAVIKTCMNAGHVLVTTLARARVKVTLAIMGYNMFHLRSLCYGKRKEVKRPRRNKAPWGIATNTQELFAMM